MKETPETVRLISTSLKRKKGS